MSGKNDYSAEDDVEGQVLIENAVMSEYRALIEKLKKEDEEAKKKALEDEFVQRVMKSRPKKEIACVPSVR